MVIGDGAGQQIFAPLPASVAAGDVFYATGAKILARLAKGTAGQVLQMNTGATAPQWITVPFTKSFESAQQTITSGALVTVAHGLGAQPKLYGAYLQCVTAERGYSVGQEIPATISNANTNSVALNPFSADATNIYFRYSNNGSCFEANDFGSGGGANNLTNANWKLVLRAWA